MNGLTTYQLEASVKLLPAVASQSVDFSIKSLFMPTDSFVTCAYYVKASLEEMHAAARGLKTSPSERLHIARRVILMHV